MLKRTTLAALLSPPDSQVTVVEARHLRREPGRHVHPVGHVSDRDPVLGPAGKDRITSYNVCYTKLLRVPR